MTKSIISQGYSYDEEQWVVSLVNTGKGAIGELFGHAVIVVEGKLENGLLFFGEYDITANSFPEEKDNLQESLGNTMGYITKIRCNPKPQARAEQTEDLTFSHRNYTEEEYSAKSWYVSPNGEPKSALKMIEAIEADAAVLDHEITSAIQEGRNVNWPFKYQKAGAHRWTVWGGNGGHNCLTYAEEKLALAGAGNGVMLTDSSKASTQIHVRCVLS